MSPACILPPPTLGPAASGEVARADWRPLARRKTCVIMGLLRPGWEVSLDRGVTPRGARKTALEPLKTRHLQAREIRAQLSAASLKLFPAAGMLLLLSNPRSIERGLIEAPPRLNKEPSL